jgi:UTP:GlnB (protein PII) uridylyltransferase
VDATATVRPEGRSLFAVEIAGQLPVFWAGNLLAALAARNIDVVSGRAVGEKRNWTATLVLDARRAAAAPDTLDFVALAHTDAVPTSGTDLKLTSFTLTPLADGRLEVRVNAPDQPGFLSRLVRTMALVSLFPREFDIDTPGGRINDRFVVSGAGGAVSPTAVKALEKMLTEYAAK